MLFLFTHFKQISKIIEIQSPRPKLAQRKITPSYHDYTTNRSQAQTQNITYITQIINNHTQHTQTSNNLTNICQCKCLLVFHEITLNQSAKY